MHSIARRRIPLLLALLALAVAPMALVGLLAADRARTAVQERVTEAQLGIAEALAVDTQQDLGSALSYARGVVRRPGFIGFVKSADVPALQDVMERVAADGPYFSRLTAFDAAGRRLHSFPAAREPLPLDQSQADLAGDPPPVQIGDDGRAIMRITLPVHADRSEVDLAGWLVAEMPIEKVITGLEDVRVGRTGNAMLVQRNGRVLVSGDQRRGRVLKAPALRAAAEGLQTTSINYYGVLTRQRELAAVVPVEHADWSVVVSQAEREVFAPVRNIERALLAIFLVTLLAAAAAAWWLAAFVHRHARALAASEERAQHANIQLQQADEMKSQFLAMASHELRTPLTAIEGFTSTMLHRWSQLADSEKLRFLEIIDRQSHRLSRLVEDLLTLSKVESGKLQVERVPVDVALTIKRVIRELGVEHAVSTSAPEQLTVLADEGHLTQILVNFIGNARKYGEPPITVSASRTNGWVDICVADQGRGVPEEFVPQLFEPFVRARSDRGSPEGTGLGLSIVRGLAEAQGGTVSYEPNAPTGSIFTARLPYVERNEPDRVAV